MAAELSAFGYTVPVSVVLAFIALVLGLALAVSLYLSVGWSVYRSVERTRREGVRDDVETALLDRLFAPDPKWEAWAAGLSAVERDVAETLLDEYLRTIEGQDAERLRELGDALGLPERAGRMLASGETYEVLQALTWLTLLERHEVYEASAFEPQTTRERAAVARLRAESDGTATTRELLSLLFAGADSPFSVFGQDTLYQVANEEPPVLLELAADRYQEWPKTLLVQVLAVCQHIDTTSKPGPLAWLIAALEHDDEGVRVAAARALGNFGWDRTLRDGLLSERAVADPSPRVRRGVYEMLAAWGDESAVSVLLFALVTEDDRRTLAHGLGLLVTRRDRLGEPALGVFGDAWEWSDEHGQFDDLARTGGRANG